MLCLSASSPVIAKRMPASSQSRTFLLSRSSLAARQPWQEPGSDNAAFTRLTWRPLLPYHRPCCG
jgi:hypothetical protein